MTIVPVPGMSYKKENACAFQHNDEVLLPNTLPKNFPKYIRCRNLIWNRPW